MFTKLKYFLCGLALVGCVAQPIQITDTAPPHPPLAEFEKGQPYSMAANGTLRMKLNPDYIPENAATLEIVYNGAYLGYYEVSDIIYLPKHPGKKVSLVAIFADKDGNKISAKTYYIKL